MRVRTHVYAQVLLMGTPTPYAGSLLTRRVKFMSFLSQSETGYSSAPRVILLLSKLLEASFISQSIKSIAEKVLGCTLTGRGNQIIKSRSDDSLVHNFPLRLYYTKTELALSHLNCVFVK